MADYDLKQLREAGERALRDAHEVRGEIDGAINWRDLHCVAALRVEDDYGEIQYRIEVEEAAPDNTRLSKYLSDHLAMQGFPDVVVYTEW